MTRAQWQPILEFKLRDNVDLNIKFFSGNSFKEVKWLDMIVVPRNPSVSFELNKTRDYKESEYFDLTRICEIELAKSRWIDLNQFDYISELDKILKVFSEVFEFKEGFFAHNGIFLLKLVFEAKNQGHCDLSECGRILLKVKGATKKVKNEVRVKTLMIDRSSTLEMRQGDRMTFYLAKDFEPEIDNDI